jgi:hypothetical protein
MLSSHIDTVQLPASLATHLPAGAMLACQAEEVKQVAGLLGCQVQELGSTLRSCALCIV